ncbi:MAG: hypothetical protein ABJG68_00555 [Crocinitomicaceae bacterium]
MRLLLVIFFFTLLYQLKAQNIDTFRVEINNETCLVVPDGSNLDAIPINILGLAPLDLRVNRKGGTWGLGQVIHMYNAKNQWYTLENNFLFTPLDFRQRYTNQEKLNFYRLELKSLSHFYFFKKEKVKLSRLNIADNKGTPHQLNFNWPSTIRYGAGLGIEYQQYSMNEIEYENLIIGNQNIVRSTQLMGQKQLVFSVGLKRQQVKGFKCDFCQLGPFDAFNIREFYVDGLVAPIQQVYGKVIDSVAFSQIEYQVEEKKLQNFDYNMIRIGGRIGFRRLAVWHKLPQIILSFGGELGWYTGPSVYNFELSLKIGVYFRSLKGIIKDGIKIIE